MKSSEFIAEDLGTIAGIVGIGTILLGALAAWARNLPPGPNRLEPAFVVYRNGKVAPSGILVNQSEAIAVIKKLAEKEHDPNTFYTIADADTNKIVFRFSLKDPWKEPIAPFSPSNTNENKITELTRRDFLKGAGAAALGTATNTIAAPFKHGTYKDELADKVTGKYVTVDSDDGSARLTINTGNLGAWLTTSQMINVRPGSSGMFSTNVRYKLGDNPVIDIGGWHIGAPKYKHIQLGDGRNDSLAKNVLRHTGILKIEVEMQNERKQIFTFQIESDAATKSASSQFQAKQDIDSKRDRELAKKKEQDELDVQIEKDRNKERVKAHNIEVSLENFKSELKYKSNHYLGWPHNRRETKELEGKVEVTVTIGTDGNLANVAIKNSSGNNLLDNSALDAVKQTMTIISRPPKGKEFSFDFPLTFKKILTNFHQG